MTEVMIDDSTKPQHCTPQIGSSVPVASEVSLLGSSYMNGWIKLHRKLTEWEWYDKSEMVHLLIHILIKANHSGKTWHGEQINAGEFITSLNHLSMETHLTPQTIRTCLKRLKQTGEIEIKSTNASTKITVCKYESYQVLETEANKRLTNEQQTTNKRLTTTKEDKECKEVKKRVLRKPTEDEVIDFFKSYKLDSKLALEAFEYYSIGDWHDRNGDPVINWKQKMLNAWIRKALKTKEKESKFCKNPC